MILKIYYLQICQVFVLVNEIIEVKYPIQSLELGRLPISMTALSFLKYSFKKNMTNIFSLIYELCIFKRKIYFIKISSVFAMV